MHGRDLAARRTICNVVIDRTAVVLGSSQHSSSQHGLGQDFGASAVLDLQACKNAGVEVVKRRSGGGLVYLAPGQHIWIDVVIARGDTLWNDDVGESALWIGNAWCRALETLGHRNLRVNCEATAQTQLGRLICFAGSGTGEVFIGDKKIVGISQRRTSKLARFQCIVYREWRPQQLMNLLSDVAREVVAKSSGVVLSDMVATIDQGADEVLKAFAAQLQAL